MSITAPPHTTRRFIRNSLVWISFAGFVLRLFWWQFEAPVISMDAAEYLCASRNLAAGHGFVGCYQGPELMYAPLYPLLTAALSFLVRNIEVAAHILPLLFGVALIPLAFFTASLVYGKRVGYVAAVLTTFHPVLIKLAGSTYNEALYLTLFMAGIYSALRALELRNTWYPCVTGASFGLAYLTRPEASAYPLFFTLAIWIVTIMTRKNGRWAVSASIRLLGLFLLTALPYVVFLHAHTGQLRLEGKWDINYTIGNRIQEGMDYEEAAYGIGRNPHASGPLLSPGEFAAYTPFSDKVADKFRYMAREALANRFDVYKSLTSYLLGDPIIFVLVLIGLFRKSWNARRLLNETVLATMVASILILLLTAQHIETRYLFPLIPLMILWSSKGIEELGQWTRSLVAGLRAAWLPASRWFGIAAQVSAALLVVLVSLYGSRSLFEFTVEQRSQLPLEEAGLWIKQHSPGETRVATWDTRLAWYADAVFVPFPDADSCKTLQYLESEKPEFIYIGALRPRAIRTLQDWLDHGIPDSRVRLVYRTKTDTGMSVIYRWVEQESPKRSGQCGN